LLIDQQRCICLLPPSTGAAVLTHLLAAMIVRGASGNDGSLNPVILQHVAVLRRSVERRRRASHNDIDRTSDGRSAPAVNSGGSGFLAAVLWPYWLSSFRPVVPVGNLNSNILMV
jgi:hypothetical protein